MKWIPSVGDCVESRYTHKRGMVIEVNEYWGWFLVKYENSKKEYKISEAHACSVFQVLSEKEFIDSLLRNETFHGLDDTTK